MLQKALRIVGATLGLLAAVGIAAAAETTGGGMGWGKAIGAAIAIGLPALGTGYAQAKIGAAGAGALAERPEVTGNVIVLVAIPETAVVLGLVISALIIFT